MNWSSRIRAKWRFVPAALTVALFCASCGKPDPVTERCGSKDKGELLDVGDPHGDFVLCKDGGVYWVKHVH